MAAGSDAEENAMDIAYDAGFAEYYDEHFGEEHEEIRRQFMDWMSGLGVSPKQFVDVGCGSGHLLQAVVDDDRFAGWDIAGFDLSKHMAGLAEAKMGDKGTVWVDSATTWSAKGGDGSVGVVASTFNAFNHIPGKENIAASFKRAAACLAPGGHMLVDVLTRLGFDRLIVNTTEEAEDGSGGLYISSGARVDGKTVALRELVYMPAPGGLFKRIDSHVTMHFYALDRIKAMIEDAGLVDVTMYAGYDRIAEGGSGDLEEELAVAKETKALEMVFTARKPSAA